jgi:hypothetical protein
MCVCECVHVCIHIYRPKAQRGVGETLVHPASLCIRCGGGGGARAVRGRIMLNHMPLTLPALRRLSANLHMYTHTHSHSLTHSLTQVYMCECECVCVRARGCTLPSPSISTPVAFSSFLNTSRGATTISSEPAARELDFLRQLGFVVRAARRLSCRACSQTRMYMRIFDICVCAYMHFCFNPRMHVCMYAYMYVCML